MAVHHDLELNHHPVFLVAKLLNQVADNLLGTNLESKALTCRILLLGVALFQEIQSCKMLQKCLRKSPTKWNWQLNYHVLVTDCLRTLTLHATGSFPRPSGDMQRCCCLADKSPCGCQISAQEPVQRYPQNLPGWKRSIAIRNSHGPNPKRKNCQKISITQCKTASKATQILLMRIINRMNSHISPWTGLTYPQITWFSSKKRSIITLFWIGTLW